MALGPDPNFRRIIAIGGGDFKRGTVLSIDQGIISLCRKENPQLLYIPTANGDRIKFCERIIKPYFEDLGADVDFLYLIRDKLSVEEIKKKLHSTDVIYVGGGNTLMMMRLWRRIGFDSILKKAWISGKILCGRSAGGICWFRFGNSDSHRYYNPQDNSLIRVRGLGLIDASFCPHYNSEKLRRKSFQKMMRKTAGVGFGCDETCAIEFTDTHWRVLSANPAQHVFGVFWKNREMIHEPIPAGAWYSLAGLSRGGRFDFQKN